MTILIISWLTILTGYVIFFKIDFSKLKIDIKYLLPFVQDKTLKALTSYINDDDNSELKFDENGDLLEKEKPSTFQASLFNKKFTFLPEDCKCFSIHDAILKRIAHKIAKYRFSIDREKITTKPNKVCLFWKPGTIFAQLANKDIIQFFVLRENAKPLFLYSSVDKGREGNGADSSFENFTNADIELLALPEEYLK